MDEAKWLEIVDGANHVRDILVSCPHAPARYLLVDGVVVAWQCDLCGIIRPL